MAAIGDKRDLQSVLDVVYESALSTCGSRATAMGVVENTKIELLRRGLFVNFDGPPPDQALGPAASWEAREAEARVKRYGSTMHAKDIEEYERIKPLVPREPSFEELRAKNQAEGGCGCAPGTILCPH